MVELRTVVRKYKLRAQTASSASSASSQVLYKLAPTSCLPFAVHLLAHLPTFPSADEWKTAIDTSSLARAPQNMLSALLEALVHEDVHAAAGAQLAPSAGTIALLLHMLQVMGMLVLCVDC